MKGRLYIYGTGAHARKVFHCARACGYEVAGFVDDDPLGQSPVPGLHVWLAAALPPPARGDAAFVAIGRADVRKRIMDRLAHGGWECPSLVHPSATVAPDVRLEAGVLIAAGVVIETATVVGRGAIVDIGALVDHDCMVGSFGHLGPGEVLGPGVKFSSSLELI